jgi:hypothetical protein
MFDDTDIHGGDGDSGDDNERFDRFLDEVDEALIARSQEAMGEAEIGLVEDMSDDEIKTVDQVVDFIIADRQQRAADGAPSGAI